MGSFAYPNYSIQNSSIRARGEGGGGGRGGGGGGGGKGGVEGAEHKRGTPHETATPRGTNRRTRLMRTIRTRSSVAGSGRRRPVGDARSFTARSPTGIKERPPSPVVHAALERDAGDTMRRSTTKGFMGDDIPPSRRARTFLDWPEPLKRRIAHLLPPDKGGASPMRWNRTPDTARLEM